MNKLEALIAVERERHKLRDLLMQVVHNRSDTEDLIQHAYESLWRSSTNHFDRPLMYVYITARHIWASECQRISHQARRRHSSFEAELLISPAPPIEDEVLGQMLLSHLLTSLAELDPKKRRIFEMHDLENYRYEEIAEQFQISPSMVKKHLSHARHKLSELRLRLGDVHSRPHGFNQSPSRTRPSAKRVRSTGKGVP